MGPKTKPYRLLLTAAAAAGVFTICGPARADFVAARDMVLDETTDTAGEGDSVNDSVPQWTYGYRSTYTGVALTKYTAAQHTDNLGAENSGSTADDDPNIQGWFFNSALVPCIVANVSGATINTFGLNLDPDQIGIHAGTDAVGVIRWTAPAAGQYTISAAWEKDHVNPGDTGVDVLLNGVDGPGGLGFSRTVLNQSQTATLSPITVSLNAGDFLDFTSDTNGTLNSDFVAFNATITAVPEPGVAFLSVAAGLAGCALRRRSAR